MDWLEDELKQALRRKEPSPDFEAKVVAATRRPAVVTMPVTFPANMPANIPVIMPRWVAAAAAMLVLTGAGAEYRRHQGQIAKEQVMQAMRLAGTKLNRAQMQIRAVRQ